MFWGVLVSCFVECPSIGLCLVYVSWLEWTTGLGRKTTKLRSQSHHIYPGDMPSTWLVTKGGNFGHVADGLPVCFPHCSCLPTPTLPLGPQSLEVPTGEDCECAPGLGEQLLQDPLGLLHRRHAVLSNWCIYSITYVSMGARYLFCTLRYNAILFHFVAQIIPVWPQLLFHLICVPLTVSVGISFVGPLGDFSHLQLLPAPLLKSAISPRNSYPFLWRMVLETKILALSSIRFLWLLLVCVFVHKIYNVSCMVTIYNFGKLRRKWG